MSPARKAPARETSVMVERLAYVAFESLRAGCCSIPCLYSRTKGRAGLLRGVGIHTDLDATVGVREATAGYRDKWRIWLAGGGISLLRTACRALKTRRLPDSRTAGTFLLARVRRSIPTCAL